MNFRRIIVGLIVVAVLAGAGYFGYQQFLAPQPEEEEASVAEVNTIAVDTGVDVVSAEGVIVPLRHAVLSFQVPGEVAEILVEEGTTVAAGDSLVRLDTTDLELAVTQAEAGLAQAEANLQTAEAGLSAAETGLTAADIGVTAAEVQLALVTAEPLPEEIAIRQGNVASANAAVSQAAASRDVTVEAATAAEIAAAEAQLAAAIAERRPIQEGYSQMVRADEEGDSVEIARIRLNAAQANVNAAQAALEELNEGATAAQRQAANAAVAAAAARRDAAQAQLDLLQAGAKPEQVQVAEVGVDQAEAAVAEAELAVEQAEAAVAQAEAGVEQARTTLESAQVALERMTLKAPFDGRVGDLSVEVGEVVSPGMPAVTLADFSEWLVETTDLTELDVVSVSVGMPVEVNVDAIPDEALSGTVTDIATVSTLTRGDVTYVVTIEIDETDLPLRWGMTTFVEIDVG